MVQLGQRGGQGSLVLALVVLGLLMMRSAADSQIHQEGYCVMYGKCTNSYNCANNILAPPVSEGNHATLLAQVCPHLAGSTEACCDVEQLDALNVYLAKSLGVLNRCPSCEANLRRYQCELACGRDQSVFVEVVDTVEVVPGGGQPNSTAVEKVRFYATQQWADDTLRSCRYVFFPSANRPVIDINCNGFSAEQCEPEVWMDAMGNPANKIASFTTDVVLTDKVDIPGMKPLNPTALSCAEPASADGSACSCQDCPDACPAGIKPTIPPTPEPFTVANIDGIMFIVIVSFCGFTVIFLAGLLLYHCRRSPSADPEGEGSDKSERKTPQITNDDVSCFERIGKIYDDALRQFFTKLGTFVATYPVSILVIAIAIGVPLSIGFVFSDITTDPVELWSGPQSRARTEKVYYEKTFVPFQRTEQLIITANPAKYSKTQYKPYNSNETLTFGSVLNIEVLEKILDVQKHLQNMKVNRTLDNGGVEEMSLADICWVPVTIFPPPMTCAITSPLQWFQSNYDTLQETAMSDDGQPQDWRDHFLYCVRNPLALSDGTNLNIPLGCISEFLGPSYPFVVLGGYETTEEGEPLYHTAEAVMVTYAVNNYRDDGEDLQFKRSVKWEEEAMKYIEEYMAENDDLIIRYMMERSIEDALIESSQADIVTIIISYLVIFAYIAVALGEFSTFKRIFIDSKITLGLGGIFVILLSVVMSLGIYGYLGIATTLIIIEVVPFLLLAVGADNIFILVLEYQRDIRRPKETREQQIGRVLGKVAPGMLMCGLSESISFFLGALTDVPAVQTFALYAGLAVLIDFLLQITAFVALLSLDLRRQESGRMDILCCFPPCSKSRIVRHPGFIQVFFKKFYCHFLLNKFVKPIVFLGFIAAFLTCGLLTLKLPVGLEQEIPVPDNHYLLDYFDYVEKYLSVGPPMYFLSLLLSLLQNHYLLDYFDYVEKYLSVGPPMYFVIKHDKLDMTRAEDQNLICGSSGCDPKSLAQQVFYAAQIKEYTKISTPPTSWIDDYFDWLNPSTVDTSCCKLYSKHPQDFCDFSFFEPCEMCLPLDQKGIRPTGKTFQTLLPFFIDHNPGVNCPKGGRSAYHDALHFTDEAKTILDASYFFAFHTVLTRSEQFTAAVKESRVVAEQIKMDLKMKRPDLSDNFDVFSYSFFYVYYEQYIDLVDKAIVNICIAMVPIFVVSFFALGFDVISAFFILINIIMIIVDTLGVMYLWGVDFNAISLVNLTMAIGMSVEFVSHTTRTFRMSTKPTRNERAKYALYHTGSAVLSGVAMTNLPGTIVLVFATSQLFDIFYFRMFLTITLLGTAHGIIFLPVLLSYFGPPVNKAQLLYEQDEERKKLLVRPTKQEEAGETNMYDNTALSSDELNDQPPPYMYTVPHDEVGVQTSPGLKRKMTKEDKEGRVTDDGPVDQATDL
ncbi:LOW QUALITY PROTEIN: Niemann-Pick C1 protein-like [Acanthaster planci]|uniref:LOW QUALITY PROTEIN: Niemann-Pick C1 protein-like n=1 Tax=Acanthaster planci TaxID=133434 RepID=A0A8B7XUZ1_ACAPL|nr:LOW QUALITY PROTEIN: Niemann-Pick C1 protein-like [Acanthaster planci]